MLVHGVRGGVGMLRVRLGRGYVIPNIEIGKLASYANIVSAYFQTALCLATFTTDGLFSCHKIDVC